jgi:multimeric flavodoxin WrbA
MAEMSKKLKVVAFNGSSKPDGNTVHLIKMVFAELEKEGIETELVNLFGVPVRGCQGCGGCKGNNKCAQVKGDDPVNKWYEKLLEADGIILGIKLRIYCNFCFLASPTEFANLSVELKCLIDRFICC